MRKNALLLWILIGASLSSSYATENDPTKQSDADMIRAQNQAYVESLYNDCVRKDKALIALEEKLETAKRDLKASEERSAQFRENQKLQTQLAGHQTAFNIAQEEYTAHREALLMKFYESCAKPEHADLAFDYATGLLGRHDPSEKLQPDIILRLMKIFPIVKDLYRVNKAFYALTHSPELEDKFQHVVPNPDAFAQIGCFCANVKLKFQALPAQISMLQNVRVLDICKMNIGQDEARALGQLPHIHTFKVGKGNGRDYYEQACTDSKSNDPELARAGWALFSILLRDPQFPTRLETAQKLFHYSCPEELKSLAIFVINQIMRTEGNINCFEAARTICGITKASGLSFNDHDISFAFNLLSKGAEDHENPACGVCALSLYHSRSEKYRDLAFSVFRKKIQDKKGHHRRSYAWSLLQSKDEQDHTSALNYYQEALLDKKNSHRIDDAENLLWFYDRHGSNPEIQKYKDLALNVMQEISEDKKNPHNAKAQKLLMKYGNKMNVVAAALDSTQGIEVQAKTLQNIEEYTIEDPDDKAKLKQVAVKIFNDESLDVLENINLISWVGKGNVSKETYARLLAFFGSEKKDSLKPDMLVLALHTLLDCPYSDLHQKAEDLFFQDFLKLNCACAKLAEWEPEDLVKKLSEDKKKLWVQKASEMLLSSPLTDDKNFELACLVLDLSNELQFVTPAQDVVRKTFNKHEAWHLEKVTPACLNHLTDAELKTRIASALFSVLQHIDLKGNEEGFTHYFDFYTQKKALGTLLTQANPSIREEVVRFCARLIELATEENHTRPALFGTMGSALSKIDGCQDLAKQVYTLLVPHFESVLTKGKSDIDYACDALKFFLVMGDEQEKTGVYTLCCQVVGNVMKEEFINEVGEIITTTLDAEHPWSKEITILMEKRKAEFKIL